MQTNGLIEISLYVQDMPRMVAFHRDILGLDISFPTGPVDFSAENWVTFATNPEGNPICIEQQDR